MSVQIIAPNMGESINEATVSQWLKKEGEAVEADELIAEIETEKVNLEVTAPTAGVLAKIMAGEGSTVHPDDVMGEITEGAAAPKAAAETPAEKSAAEPAPAKNIAPQGETHKALSPAVQKLVTENNLNPGDIQGTGKDGRLTKGDVLAFLESGSSAQKDVAPQQPSAQPVAPAETGARERREPMSRLRKTIAIRLKTAQNTAAMLTTYNEVDLLAVNKLRRTHQEKFVEKYGVKLGYMSLFTKAAVSALKAFPALNAEIDTEAEEIIYKDYHDIGIAVGSSRGLVVPVVRDADGMNFADIELKIKDFGKRAQEGKLMPDELAGASFTITNGGVFGSMMSMPILNYPQVGILGMHAIKERPVVVNGEIVIRPMMYLALTYDHRIVDGKEAVSFLVHIKESLETPEKMLLDL